MSYGAGYVAARKWGAKEIVSPYPYAVGSIKETYEKYGQTRDVLPAMGYSPEQIRELQETIDRAPVDLVVMGTPIDLRRVMQPRVPAVRVSYELVEIGEPNLRQVISGRWPSQRSGLMDQTVKDGRPGSRERVATG